MARARDRLCTSTTLQLGPPTPALHSSGCFLASITSQDPFFPTCILGWPFHRSEAPDVPASDKSNPPGRQNQKQYQCLSREPAKHCLPSPSRLFLCMTFQSLPEVSLCCLLFLLYTPTLTSPPPTYTHTVTSCCTSHLLISQSGNKSKGLEHFKKHNESDVCPEADKRPANILKTDQSERTK